jgi:hypothetical protein
MSQAKNLRQKLSRGRVTVVSLAMLPLFLLSSSIAAGAASPSWSVISTSNLSGPSDNDSLYGMSCVSTNTCVAVGWSIDQTAHSVSHTLIESLAGNSWSIVASPDQGTAENYLNGVSCLNAQWCLAVGDDSDSNSTLGVSKTLIELWDGESWSTAASPNAPAGSSFLNGVSCLSSTSCIAVGYTSSSSSPYQPLSESWNGATWSLLPEPVGVTGQLNGVSCISQSSCVAVGQTDNATVTKTLIESWNGAIWTVMASRNVGKQSNQLNGVSCVAGGSCTAVGFDNLGRKGNHNLIEYWSGGPWSVGVSPKIRNTYMLNGISCLSDGTCEAVGETRQKGSPKTLVESWNGSVWSIEASPNSPPSGNFLQAVSCVSGSSCDAAGYFWASKTTFQVTAEVEAWNGGTWSITPKPDPTTNYNNLSSVSCSSTTSCTAVGTFQNRSGYYQTLIESSSGSDWSIQSSPNVAGSSNSLAGVSCVSATFCDAVGNSYDGAFQTLIETWNGTSWTIVPSPDGSGSNELYGVSCLSSTSCLAVGGSVVSSDSEVALIESWNGSVWSIMSSPSAGQTAELDSVSCSSEASCIAVGHDSGNSGGPMTLIESWNGTSWSTQESLNVGSTFNELNGVFCISDMSCTAIGSSVISGGFGALIESWNGSTWAIQPSPNDGTSATELFGLACSSSDSCTAVGLQAASSTSSLQTLVVESSDGGTWSIVSSPNEGTSDNTLNGLWCTAQGSPCEAVGDVGTTGISVQSLAESYS